MERELQYSYRKYENKDQLALEGLLKSAFTSFSQSGYWFWKYRANPYFDPSLIVLAEKDGKLVGCNHWLLRDLKLTSSATVRAALGADIAVSPEERGHGIGRELVRYFRLSGAFKKKAIVISYMFSDPRLRKRLYEPAAGYIIAPNSTTTYKKFFNCRKLKEEFQLINDAIDSKKTAKIQLKGLKLCVLFRLQGTPSFSVYVGPEGIHLDEGEAKNPDVVVEGGLPLSFSFIESKSGLWDWAKAWLIGRFRIKKGKFKITKMLRVFRLIKQAISED
jgi:predicted N-acetyltransferase YhbS